MRTALVIVSLHASILLLASARDKNQWVFRHALTETHSAHLRQVLGNSPDVAYDWNGAVADRQLFLASASLV